MNGTKSAAFQYNLLLIIVSINELLEKSDFLTKDWNKLEETMGKIQAIAAITGYKTFGKRNMIELRKAESKYRVRADSFRQVLDLLKPQIKVNHSNGHKRKRLDFAFAQFGNNIPCCQLEWAVR